MILDLVADAIARLTGQFQNSPKLQAALQAIIEPLNLVETDLDDLKTNRWLNTAYGVQLDGLGALVGERRESRDDETYREVLRFRVFINASRATPPNIIYALRNLTRSDNTQYNESWPATVFLYADGYGASSHLPNAMQDLMPAAISDIDIVVSFGEESFRMSNAGQMTDESSELAGLAASVLYCIDGRRLRTAGNKRLRLRTGYSVHKTKATLAGLFEKR